LELSRPQKPHLGTGNHVGSRKNRPAEQAAKTTLFAAGNRVASRKSAGAPSPQAIFSNRNTPRWLFRNVVKQGGHVIMRLETDIPDANQEQTMTDTDILICPDCRAGPKTATGELVCSSCGRSLLQSPLYLEALATGDRAFGKDFSNLFRYVWLAGRDLGDLVRWEFRKEITERLELPPSARVLEVMIGDGKMVPYVMKRLGKPKRVQFHAIHKSPRLLERCTRMRWRGVDGRLYLADARRLPFRDAAFDAVYCVGGVDSDPGTGKSRGPAVVAELIRTAKPGARIVIEDRTQSRRVFISAANLWFREKKLRLTADADLDIVPQEMEERRIEQIGRGREYCITFRKPSQVDGS
jgi:ubiquinone/menaquinone biosynthesis C-methylase UbiE